MAILTIPDENKKISDFDQIKSYLNNLGITYEKWQANTPLEDVANQETVLKAYEHVLTPFMNKNGYKTADVININQHTENYDQIRAKFLAEHTHTEDEIRFFVDGEGLFWFNLGNQTPIFNVLCQKGDLISVPANTKHWFDAGEENPFVKAIRIFIDVSGWVPHYTDSGVDQKYLK